MSKPNLSPLRDDERCVWEFEIPGKPKRKSNFLYTRTEAEAKWGPGWCEPLLETRASVEPGGYGGDSQPYRTAE